MLQRSLSNLGQAAKPATARKSAATKIQTGHDHAKEKQPRPRQRKTATKHKSG
ncbi:hypothetical protein ACFS07_10025 [Undibacterium arcticum]